MGLSRIDRTYNVGDISVMGINKIYYFPFHDAKKKWGGGGVRSLLFLFMAFPGTTASAERSFSNTKLIKNSLR